MTSDYLFDSETYYKSSGIYLTVNNAENIQIVHNNSHKIKKNAYVIPRKAFI